MEAAVLEQAPELDFGEAKPDVGVHLAGFFELMAQEIEDGDAAPGFENAPSLGYR